MKQKSRTKWWISATICAIISLVVGIEAYLPWAKSSTQQTEDPWMLLSMDPIAQAPELSTQADRFVPEERIVPLYFRMRDEALLARETGKIYLFADKPLERVLIEKLIEGPGADALELTSPFIPGTRVVDTMVDGSLLVVTLSREFLGTPADAPLGWESIPEWRAEVLLRRKLALASIVATITEATEHTQVQLLIRYGTEGITGERVGKSLFETVTEGTPLLEPMGRTEEVLLTHHNTASILLSCWKHKDFGRLFRFVKERPTEAAFLSAMAAIENTLVDYQVSAGTVASDGGSATLVLTLTLLSREGERILTNYPLRLTLEKGLWKIEYTALLRMMEAK